MYLDKIIKIINEQIDLASNEEIKTRLQKCLPEINIFQKILKTDITKEEYDKILNQVNEIVSFNETFIEEDYLKNINEQLYNVIRDYYNFYYSIEIKEDSYKVYPVSINQKEAKRIYEKEIRDLIRKYMGSSVSFDILIDEKIQEYKQKNEKFKYYLHKEKIEPYYGNPEFMFKRALYVSKCANKLIDNPYNINEIIKKMELFYNKYPMNNDDFIFPYTYPYYSEEFKKDYNLFENDYLKILDIEQKLVPVVEQRWKKFLTDPNNHDDNNFAYIIHVFSGNFVEPQKMYKSCCTLATNRLLTTPYGTAGLIYELDMDAVEIMSIEDAGSWVIDKQYFINRGLPKTWQLTNPEGNSVYYEETNLSKLILPDEFEKKVIERNFIYNGEILNYQKGLLYSEIYLNEKAKAIGAFYIDQCANVEGIKEYVKKYNLPLVHLSLEKLREMANLSSEQKLEEDFNNLKK